MANNVAEYEALLQGKAMVRKIGGKAVEMFSDFGSQRHEDPRVLEPSQMPAVRL